MSAVEGQAVALADSEVPIALELVDMAGDETSTAIVLGWAGLDRFLAAVVGELEGVRVEGGGCGGVGGVGEVEAEEGVGVEVVEGRPGAVPVVGELDVGVVAGEGKGLPFDDVGFRDVLVGLGF